MARQRISDVVADKLTELEEASVVVKRVALKVEDMIDPFVGLSARVANWLGHFLPDSEETAGALPPNMVTEKAEYHKRGET